jgi:hypothetical protein
MNRAPWSAMANSAEHSSCTMAVWVFSTSPVAIANLNSRNINKHCKRISLSILSTTDSKLA